MRWIGIDLGERWIGIALSDGTGSIARPLEVVEGVQAALLRVTELLREEEIGGIVLGLPRNMDGSLGRKAKEALAFGEVLRSRFSVPVETWDERLTTVEADRYLREAEMTARRRKERVNQVAAQILLQSYLDARKGARAAPGEEGEPPGEEETEE
jgi:putative Holliday junction resolvase